MSARIEADRGFGISRKRGFASNSAEVIVTSTSFQNSVTFPSAGDFTLADSGNDVIAEIYTTALLSRASFGAGVAHEGFSVKLQYSIDSGSSWLDADGINGELGTQSVCLHGSENADIPTPPNANTVCVRKRFTGLTNGTLRLRWQVKGAVASTQCFFPFKVSGYNTSANGDDGASRMVATAHFTEVAPLPN